MFVSYTERSKKLKQLAGETSVQLFGKLQEGSGQLPSEVRIKISTVYHGEMREVGDSVPIPTALSYDSEGQLSGEIRGHCVSVISDGSGHYVTTIDGRKSPRLTPNFVETEFGITVKKKQSGTQKGSPSETVGRAVWRHLVDRYNSFDNTVQFEESNQL